MSTFDLSALTLGEVAYIEDLAAQPITALDDPAARKGNLIAAVYVVAQRRAGAPAYTFNLALDVPMSEAATFLGLSEEQPATEIEQEAAVEEGKDERSDASESADEPSSSLPSASL